MERLTTAPLKSTTCFLLRTLADGLNGRHWNPVSARLVQLRIQLLTAPYPDSFQTAKAASRLICSPVMGVAEFQILGVEEISSVAGEAGEFFERLAGWAIQRVAYQGMADGCEMDSDFSVRAARIQDYRKCCGAGGA